MEKLKITEGDTTLSPQLKNMQAQVWDAEGKSMAIIEPTEDPAVATNIALIFSNGYNTYNKCFKLPSELIEENRELIEALKYFTNKVERGEARSKDTYAVFKALLTKIENNQTPQP